MCARGRLIVLNVVGGYMYLRSLIGPLELLYKFYDDPALIHECMKTWFELADGVAARYQQHVTIDELFIAEDICFNHGPLISPDMIREFLFPYYRQLIENIKKRQLDKTRHLYFHVGHRRVCGAGYSPVPRAGDGSHESVRGRGGLRCREDRAAVSGFDNKRRD